VRHQAEHFYEPKAEAYRRAAARLRRVEFAPSLAATVATAIVAAAGRDPTGLHFDFIALTAVLTTVAGAILAHIEASRYEFLVTSYCAAARRLRNELASRVQIPPHRHRNGPPSSPAERPLFLRRTTTGLPSGASRQASEQAGDASR
jgi:SMODS and SLOG-associating 2TM effector domain 1